MKLRLLIVILVVAALFSGVVLWRVDRFVFGDKMAWAEAQARSQISSLTQAISVEIQSARRQLSSVNADTFKPDRTNWRSFQPYYGIALMTTQNGALAISQMSTRADSPAAGWTTAQLSQYIGVMGKELGNRGTVLLRAFKDPKKNTHVALIFAGGGNAYILIGSGSNFQSLIESQRGSISSFSIIANDGLTISHGTPEYIGTVMGDSTLLKEIRSTGSSQGIGNYMQGKKQVFGMYERVPGSTVYVISTVPIEDLLRGRLSLAWQFLFLAMGFVLIGAAGYFWYEKQNPRFVPTAMAAAPRVKQEELPSIPSVSMDNVVPPMPPKPPKPPPMANNDVVTANTALVAPLAPKHRPPPVAGSLAAKGGDSVPAPATPPDWQQEKAEAYRQVAMAMGQEMRAPLASILGFSQMVLSKTQDPDVVQSVESILREARSSRDVLDKLVTFSGERNSQKSEAKIEGPISQALKVLDSRIQQKGVVVHKDFQETSPWSLSTADVAKAFESFFENAIEGMERMHDKSLQISTWESAQGLHVRIVDTGEGIDRENLGKVFEPFFTTRSFANHVGLGLPVAAGILKEHHAQVKIQSQRGKGTQVDILFPPKDSEASPSAQTSASFAPEELPAELPKVAAPSHEEVEAAMNEARRSQEKLTDMNVDNLLEMQPDEAPLQFLDGLGFDDGETTSPGTTPPNFESTQKIVLTPEPTPMPEAARPPSEAPPAVPASQSLVIDKPTNTAAVKSSALDSYKVEVKRPGKRT